MAIQIGKYKRPGIFIEEFDNSVIPTPTSVDPLVNMVIGVSKRGPVNAPVKVSTLNEFRAIYGEIDRNLERKGSFFHRTIEKMLESSPVYAMNLLLTDDVLDRVEYQSLSTSSDNLNDVKRLGAYRRFHDTTGFWKKDTESFINLTRSNPEFGSRALNITNLSDKPVSVFIYKSTASGYDVTAESWFGSIEKVPTFINPKDFISDYMVDVLIVSGDWSDYRALAQDKIWSNYFFFDPKLGSGLRKNLVSDFANNRNVNVLGYYNGLSLIPYFRNRENKNLFIETNLNVDTDKTGIFCAFNIDAIENENVSSLIDLIGHTIANKNETAINFLSYQANISEEIPVMVKPLDLPGNVTANGNIIGMTWSSAENIGLRLDTRSSTTGYEIAKSSYQSHFYDATATGAPTYSGVQTNYKNRTSWFADFTTWGIKYRSVQTPNISKVVDNKLSDGTNQIDTFTEIIINYDIHTGAYAIINGEYLPVLNTSANVTNNYKNISFSVKASDFEIRNYVQLCIAIVLYKYDTNTIEIIVNKDGDDVIGVSANDIVLNTFKFRVKANNDNNANIFVPFGTYQKYNLNGVDIEGRFSPNFIGGFYGYNKWVSTALSSTNNYSKSTITSNLAPWLNASSGADSYLTTEYVSVDTSFLSTNSDSSNPLLHDNSDYIRTFYKNGSNKLYLDNDTSAPIGVVGNQLFTGGTGSGNYVSRTGFVYDSRILTYSNIDRWNYASLYPVFATSSTFGSEVGTCQFQWDATTEQLFADFKSTSINSGISLNSGDSISVWSVSGGTKGITQSVLYSFNSNDNNNRPILLIIDRVDYDAKRIYFLNNFDGSNYSFNSFKGDNKWVLRSGVNSATFGTDLFLQSTTNFYDKAAGSTYSLGGVTGTSTATFSVSSINATVAVGGVTWSLNVNVDFGATASATLQTNARITVNSASVTPGTYFTANQIPGTQSVWLCPTASFYGQKPTGMGGTFSSGQFGFKLKQAGIDKILSDLSLNNGFTLEKVSSDLFDYKVTYLGSGKIKYTFLGTDNAKNPANYRAYRRHRMFDKLVNLLDSVDKYKRVMLLNNNSSNEKISMETMSISDIVTSPTQNKSFVLNTGLPNSEIVKLNWQRVLQGFLTIYSVDDEVILGKNGMDTKMIGLTNSVVESDSLLGDGIGVVSKYSDLYQNYYDGIINNGDYFQINRVPSKVYKNGGYTVTFFDGEDDKSITGLNTGKTTLFAGYNFLMFTASFDSGITSDTTNEIKFNIGDSITINSSSLNRKRITIISENLVSPSSNSSTLFTNSNGTLIDIKRTYIYKVVEEVVYEKIYGVDKILDNRTGVGTYFLNMFVQDKTESNTIIKNALSIRFKDSYSLMNNMPPLSNLDTLNNFNIISQSSNYKQTLELEYPATYDSNGAFQVGTSRDTDLIDNQDGTWLLDNKVLIKADRYSEIRVGDFLLGNNNRLSRILDKRIYTKDSSLVILTCSLPVRRNRFGNDFQTFLYKSVDNYTYAYKALTFKGFKVRTASLPDGTEETQENILNIVSKGTPLYRALTNKEAIDYRYLVDSFGLGLVEKSKQQLADICGSRKDIFGFLNMPSIRSFKTSTSPTYVDNNGDLVAEYIAKGSNPDKAAAFTYTFADGEGSTCVGYFTPYIKVDDDGRQVTMPPAAHVATTYMRKHTSNLGGITPWTIAAGVTNGRITNIIGLEHDYTNEDIEFLNQAQMNPIVFKRNRGHVIETENTAQTLQRSALSFIHVREVLIELERELSRMLLDFQWQYNTPDIRAEIKLRADSICETYVNRNGLYNYFNKMDDENNTSEIIDNQIGVLDTYVEPIKGMGIIVNNVTILRTGAIDAGGFM